MANELETSLIALTDAYNASQDRVLVDLQNQTELRLGDRQVHPVEPGQPPDADPVPRVHGAVVRPVRHVDPDRRRVCRTSGYDTSAFLQRTLDAYTFEGIHWSMPFNVSNPVLYYNRKMFEAAGLDPDLSRRSSLDELRDHVADDRRQRRRDLRVGGRFGTGLGWWLVPRAVVRPGRASCTPTTATAASRRRPKVLYDGETGVDLLTFVQTMINDGLAVSVGDNPGGQDAFLKMIDPAAPGAMTIGTSAALGSVIAALGGGIAPGLTTDDIGVGPMPGPSDDARCPGRRRLVVDRRRQGRRADRRGVGLHHVSRQRRDPVALGVGDRLRAGAQRLPSTSNRWRRRMPTDPRFKVPYDQLLTSVEGEASLSPVLGPQREVRVATANAVAAIFGGADVATLAERRRRPVERADPELQRPQLTGVQMSADSVQSVTLRAPFAGSCVTGR